MLVKGPWHAPACLQTAEIVSSSFRRAGLYSFGQLGRILGISPRQCQDRLNRQVHPSVPALWNKPRIIQIVQMSQMPECHPMSSKPRRYILSSRMAWPGLAVP